MALGPGSRESYVDHMLRVLPEQAQILLGTLEYDQHLVSGPPFCVLPEEVNDLYESRCSVEPLESALTDKVPPPLFSARRWSRSMGGDLVVLTAPQRRYRGRCGQGSVQAFLSPSPTPSSSSSM